MANKDTNYNNIAQPYDNYLNRSPQSEADAVDYNMSADDAVATGDSEQGSTATSTQSNTSPSGKPTVLSTSLTDIFFETFIKSRNYQPKVQGIYLDGRTGYLEAQTGNIAGWDFTKAQLSSGNVYIQSTAERILMGLATEPLTGIGIFLGKDSSDYEFRAGDPDNDYIHWTGSALNIVGSITATTGTIGGWSINPTTLSATGIILDAGNQKITVGSSSPITIDGVAKEIESDNYVSGVFGAGFHLDSNLLEVGNIACRGLIRTAVFQKDVVSVVGGNLAVLDGDVLDADMTADD